MNPARSSPADDVLAATAAAAAARPQASETADRPRVRRGRPAALLAAALVVLLCWSGWVASLHRKAQREKEREVQMLEADRSLHEIELLRWRVVTGDVALEPGKAAAREIWSDLLAAVDAAYADAEPDRVAAMRAAVAAMRTKLLADRDRVARGQLSRGDARFTPELNRVDELMNEGGEHAAASAEQTSARAWRLTAVSGAGALFVAGLLLLGFVRARRDAATLRTDAARAEGERRSALTDRQTGLANRAGFERWLRDALARGPGVAAVLIDLDDFKTVNDSLGHPAGDRCLVACADRLREAIGRRDLLARLGGDEFGVLIEAVPSPEAAESAARRLLDAVGGAVRLDGSDVPLTASAGVALAAPGDQAEDLLRCADTAVHAAKARGASHVQVYSPAMHEYAVRRLALRSALARAVEHEELGLAYQPVIDLDRTETTGVEALLRWHTPDGAPVSPADFIPIAEASGLIVPIGAWVLERACTDVAPLGELSVAVNVSAVQLRIPDFALQVADALERSGLPPRRLVLELTESAVMDDVPGVLEAFRALGALGVQVAIDDFGTGFSSLSTLAALPVDLLKLDRSFVAAMASSAPHEALVGGVVSLADRLGLPLVAEGVEDGGQLEALRALGCRYAQGFHLGRPGALAAAYAVDAGARGLR
jgi:diguanylate cyclase (GGDEF)-like protein